MRRKRRRKQMAVELNLAAMLDMAFQLLAFFIFSFKPAPIEGQISLKLPPPQPVATINAEQPAGANENNPNPVAGLNSLIVSVYPSPTGQIGSMQIDETKVGGLSQLEDRLQTIFSDPGVAFDQVILQIGSNLRYDAMMSVMNVCTHQKLANGKRLTKLSFVELPERPE